jgi:hypothetical protein
MWLKSFSFPAPPIQSARRIDLCYSIGCTCYYTGELIFFCMESGLVWAAMLERDPGLSCSAVFGPAGKGGGRVCELHAVWDHSDTRTRCENESNNRGKNSKRRITKLDRQKNTCKQFWLFCWPRVIVTSLHNKHNQLETHFTFTYALLRFKVSTCFGRYLSIFRRQFWWLLLVEIICINVRSNTTVFSNCLRNQLHVSALFLGGPSSGWD